MLHIVLLVLKIIGIILAVILGLLVLLVCIVLFVPIRYEDLGKCDVELTTLKGKVKVTWLLHLIRADVYYKEMKLKWRVRIAWKKILGGNDLSKNDVEEDIKETVEFETIEKDREIYEQKKEEPTLNTSVKEQKKDTESADDPKHHESDTRILDEPKSGDEKRYKTHSKEADEDDDKINEKSNEKTETTFEKIKYTIESICDKIKDLTEKKNKITGFIKEETHIGALLKLKEEAFKLLKKIRPKKIMANLCFGFEDPYLTGETFAGLSVIYPFLGENIILKPNFENKILKGNLDIKGHIRLCHFLVLAWRLFWSRNVRRTYKDIRNFEL